MTEHQVVVVLDIEAPDRVAAARCAVGILNGTRGHRLLPEGRPADTTLESWWFPEADLKQVDRNDNGRFRLVPDELVDCPVCSGAAEITVCANDGSHDCSHQNDRTYPCSACDSSGQVWAGEITRPDWCTTCGLRATCRECAA